jgi:hypothetical protein
VAVLASAPPARDAPTRQPTAPWDDAATVYDWLCRLTAQPAEREELLIEVLRRSREASPACLRAASDATRLRFLTIQTVLRRRGVL